MTTTIEELLNLIHQCAFQRMYGSQSEKQTSYSELYSNVRLMYTSNPEELDAASLKMLQMSWNDLGKEKQARLESVGIWHKSGLDCYLFRIRFFLKLSPETDEAFLKRSMIRAYSERAESVSAQIDCRRYYDHLFYSVFKENAEEDQNLLAALKRIDSDELVTDVDGVLAYVHIHSLPGMKVRIPPYMKVIWTAVTNLSVIEGDGLGQWLSNNKKRDLIALKNACQKICLMDTADTLEEILAECLNDPANPISSAEIDSFNGIIKQKETELLSGFDDDLLISAAEKYRAACAGKKEKNK